MRARARPGVGDRSGERAAEGGPRLEVRGLVKAFGPVTAVEGVGFEVASGEMFTLLGPSGCGKTTTLRSIAGLERPDAGEIAVSGRVLFSSSRRVDVPANERRLGMVFQSYAIWPHMDVHRNVAFPLQVLPRRHRPGRVEIGDRVEARHDGRLPALIAGSVIARARTRASEAMMMTAPTTRAVNTERTGSMSVRVVARTSSTKLPAEGGPAAESGWGSVPMVVAVRSPASSGGPGVSSVRRSSAMLRLLARGCPRSQ
jgi:ABC-type glutathione transport system ATPase component